jgi:prolipoprotein diacylglyceryl transferase
VFSILASIPSPSDNAIGIGGVQLRAYGLAIALGVVAAVWIARVRWAARGGDPDDISRIALWAVTAGLIGARLYHVLTDFDRFEGRWLHVFAVWEGGLGIPGGLIAGVGTGAYVAYRRGLPVAELLDVVAPALPVAQAIGRLGNWFNQELFGRPTDLPWGLEIDPEHRPARYLDVATFHPTFLYEALWNLALAGGLVWWERRHPGARPGRLFAFYVAGYAVGRAWVEALRIDPAAHLFGVRWNIWMSAIAFFGAVGWLVYDSWRARTEAERKPSTADTATDQLTPDTADTADATHAAETDGPDARETADAVDATETATDEATIGEAADVADPDTAERAAEEATTIGDVTVTDDDHDDDSADDTGQPDPGETAAPETAADETAASETDDSADDTGQPDVPEPTDAADGPADSAEQPTDQASANAEPAAANEDQAVGASPGSGDATTADRAPDDAASTDSESRPRTDRGRDTDVRTETADEEAAT